MVSTTARVFGSMWETEFAPVFVTQIAPSPAAMPPGWASTAVAAMISFRAGSMTPTEFSVMPASAFGRHGLQA